MAVAVSGDGQAFDVLHGHERAAVARRPTGVELRDGRVVEAGQGAALDVETAGQIGTREKGSDQLDRDAPTVGTFLNRQEDPAHPAFPEKTFHVVARNLGKAVVARMNMGARAAR